jgi:hypothetical protein
MHRDDYPTTLRLLAELAHGRALDGYELTDVGANVDWEALADENLSSTEVAVVHIAQGVATLERHGGTSTRLRNAVVRAVTDVA